MADDTNSMPYSFNPDNSSLLNRYIIIHISIIIKNPHVVNTLKCQKTEPSSILAVWESFRKFYQRNQLEWDFFKTIRGKKNIDLLYKIYYNKHTIKIQ